MGKVQFKRGSVNNLDSVAIDDGSLLVTEDTAQMFFDTGDETKEINGDIREQVESHNFGDNNTFNVDTIGVLGDNNIIAAKGYNIVGYMADSVNKQTGFRVEGNDNLTDALIGQPVSAIIDASSAARFANVVSIANNGDGTYDIVVDNYWLEHSFNPSQKSAVGSNWNQDATGDNNGVWLTGLKDNDNILIFPTMPDIGEKLLAGSNSIVGDNNQALLKGSMVMGYQNSAEGKYATALGRQNIAGYAALVGGRNNKSTGQFSTASGGDNVASGEYSATYGKNNKATGDKSCAGGVNSEASGVCAYAHGNTCIASGKYSSASGQQAIAEGSHSFSHGYKTQACGEQSVADGDQTIAEGDASHAHGYKTCAGFNQQFVVGKYNNNKADNLFEVGNGTSDTNRSNAFEVKTDGTVYSQEGKLATETFATNEANRAKSEILGGATEEELNTLKELSDALNDDENFATTVLKQISNKVDKVEDKGLSTNDFTNAYKTKLDNIDTELDVIVADTVGRFTIDGSDYVDSGYEDIRGEKFNDYGNNRALAPGSHAEGTRSMTTLGSTIDNIAGCMCYEVKAKSEILGAYTDPQITISSDRTSGTIKIKGNLKDTTYHGSGAYAQGDVFSLITNLNFDDCGTIESISDADSNGITIVTVTFYPEKITNLKGTDDYGTGLGALIPTVTSVLPFIFKVNSKPLTGVKALGLGAHTEGVGNQALSDGAHAEGRENKAMGRWSHVEGYGNITHYAAHAEGQTTEAHYVAHAEGHRTKAIGNFSHAEGLDTIAQGNNSHAEGNNTLANSSSSHAEGESTSIKDISGEVLLDGKYTVPESHGTSMWSGGGGAHAEGQHTIASSNGAHAEGNNTYAIGSCSHTEGHKTIAAGYQSHAEGYDTIASGNYAHSEGTKTEASGHDSHAEGSGSKALGIHSHAEGQGTTASEKHSHAEGYNTTAEGGQSHAEGDGTTASGTGSHAEGYISKAIGKFSHAEGNNTRAEGANSHAEGLNTQATKHSTHAEGSNTQAIGDQSHAEGLFTTASGHRAHAEGWSTESKSNGTHSSGIATIAGYQGQTVVGIANENKADNLFEVGNGSYNVESDKAIATTRSNAFEVDKNGNARANNKAVVTSSDSTPMEIIASDTQPTPVDGKTIIWIDTSALS